MDSMSQPHPAVLRGSRRITLPGESGVEFDEIRRVLEESGVVRREAKHELFTNRDLNFDTIRVVGYDMDYTLARYRQSAIDKLTRELALKKLVERGYPDACVAAPLDRDFAIRGLTVDIELGNVTKMDRHGYVGRAYHGSRLLRPDERKKVYRELRLGSDKKRFVYVDTLFELPEVAIYAGLVEFADKERAAGRDTMPSYNQIWRDVRQSVDDAHRDGTLKSVVVKDLPSFIERDDELPATLHKLRSGGKKMFLLTNSELEYTDVVMSYLLGSGNGNERDWKSYFEQIVVHAGKPGFFTAEAPLVRVKPDEAGHSPKPHSGYFRGGNQADLQELFHCEPDEVLFIGDHIYTDIVLSRKSSGWRTGLIVQELDRDLYVRRRESLKIRDVNHQTQLRGEVSRQISSMKYMHSRLQRTVERERQTEQGKRDEAVQEVDRYRLECKRRLDALRQYEAELDDTLDRRDREVESSFNRYWGSVFSARHDRSHFGNQVEFFACVYTSRVSNFLYVSPAEYFHSRGGSLPHF